MHCVVPVHILLHKAFLNILTKPSNFLIASANIQHAGWDLDNICK
jgi:hypothetical protein